MKEIKSEKVFTKLKENAPISMIPILDQIYKVGRKYSGGGKCCKYFLKDLYCSDNKLEIASHIIFSKINYIIDFANKYNLDVYEVISTAFCYTLEYVSQKDKINLNSVAGKTGLVYRNIEKYLYKYFSIEEKESSICIDEFDCYINPIDKIDDDIILNQLKDMISDILNDRLSCREEKVLCLRFGIEEEEGPLTLEEVAKEFHVSKDRIRQIQNRGMRKVKNELSKKRVEFNELLDGYNFNYSFDEEEICIDKEFHRIKFFINEKKNNLFRELVDIFDTNKVTPVKFYIPPNFINIDFLRVTTKEFIEDYKFELFAIHKQYEKLIDGYKFTYRDYAITEYIFNNLYPKKETLFQNKNFSEIDRRSQLGLMHLFKFDIFFDILFKFSSADSIAKKFKLSRESVEDIFYIHLDNSINFGNFKMIDTYLKLTKTMVSIMNIEKYNKSYYPSPLEKDIEDIYNPNYFLGYNPNNKITVRGR